MIFNERWSYDTPFVSLLFLNLRQLCAFYVNERNSFHVTCQTQKTACLTIKTQKRVETTIRSGVFVTNFELFGNVVTLS